MYKYETHMHTHPVSACGASTPEDMVRAYKQRGYAGIIITDHFINGHTGCPPSLTWDEKMTFFLSGYEKAKREGSKCGLDVFLGWEYAIHGSEFLTYGLDEQFMRAHPNFHLLNIEEYSALVRKNGGYIAQAHPYRDEVWVANPFPVAPHLIDGIESFNASMSEQSNQKALDFAKMHNLPIQAGTDAHGIRMRFTSGIIMKNRARDVFDVINAIKEKQVQLIYPGR